MCKLYTAHAIIYKSEITVWDSCICVIPRSLKVFILFNPQGVFLSVYIRSILCVLAGSS